MARITLTDKFCRSEARIPAKGRKDFQDAVVPGLALTATQTGHRSLNLIGRFPLSPKNPTRRLIGEYGAITLEDARTKARLWIELIGKGIDPKVEVERQRAAALRSQRNNLGYVAEQFLQRYVKGQAFVELERLAADLRKAHPKLTATAALRQVMAAPGNQTLVSKSKKEGLAKKQAADSIIRREFIKRWANRPVTDIEPQECATVIRALVDRGAPEQARSTYEWLRRLYTWAIGTNEFGVSTSPVANLRPTDLIGRKVQKDRILTNDELRAVWDACADMGHPYGPCVRMLILSGQRLTEVCEAPWSEFDLANETWVIGGDRMKGDHGVQLVPLCRDALALLQALPRFADGEFAFSTNGRRPVNGWSKAKARLDALSGVSGWTLHDLRRTMRSHLSALPIEEHCRELMIGHRLTGIKKVYDRHLYEAEKRAGFDLWEHRLRGIISPKPPAEVADIAAHRKVAA